MPANELLEHERELTRGDRDIRLLESSLQILREKLEEAHVSDELYAKKISNVHVFQPASYVERHGQPEEAHSGRRIRVAGFLHGTRSAHYTRRPRRSFEPKRMLNTNLESPSSRASRSCLRWTRRG